MDDGINAKGKARGILGPGIAIFYGWEEEYSMAREKNILWLGRGIVYSWGEE